MTNTPRITRADVMDLLARRFPAGVLSVYVGLSSAQRHDPQNWISTVRSGLKDLAQKHPADPSLARLIETAQTELMQLPVELRHRSFVYIRSLEPDWTFRRSLQLPLTNSFVFDQAPQVRPLVALLEKAPVVGAAVLSQTRVRVFTYKEGMVEEAPEILLEAEEEESGETTAIHRESVVVTRSGVRVRPPKNRRDDQIRRQQRQVAQRLAELGAERRWEKLLLIGQGVITTTVGSHLPERWRRHLVPPLDRNLIKAPSAEVADAVSRHLHHWRDRQALEEVEDLIQQTLAGGRSCTRVEHCLESLNEGRVERLFLRSDLRLNGFRDHEGRLYLARRGSDNGFAPEPRLVERMIAAAMESGAEVVLVEGEAAERLGLLGGVGGRLRWKEAVLRPSISLDADGSEVNDSLGLPA